MGNPSALGASGSYKYPTKAEFGRGFANALSSLKGEALSDLQAVPGVAVAIDICTSVVESALGTTIEGFLGDKLAELVSTVVDQLADASTSVASDVANQVAASVGDMAGLIPVIGQLIEIFVGIGVGLSELKRLEAVELERKWHDGCGSRMRRLQGVEGSGGRGRIDPSDVFRSLARPSWPMAGPTSKVGYWAPSADLQAPAPFRSAHPIAAMCTLLCGGEARGYGISREAYADWIKKNGQRLGIGNGISLEVRRSMFALIEGIMGAVRPPVTDVSSEDVGDNGRTLMPALMTILLEQAKKGNWNLKSARDLSERFYSGPVRVCLPAAAVTAGSGEVTVTRGGIACKVMPSCAAKSVGWDVGRDFYKYVLDWKRFVDEEFDEAKSIVAKTPKKSLLVLNKGATLSVLRRVVATEKSIEATAKAEKKRSLVFKVVGAAGAVGGGYLAWSAVRRWGPKRRRS